MKMIIGGQYVDSSDGNVKDVLDPGTMQVIDTIPAATEDDVKKAVKTAKEGQKIWENVPLHQRIDILRKYHDMFLDAKDEFVELRSKGNGKNSRPCRG